MSNKRIESPAVDTASLDKLSISVRKKSRFIIKCASCGLYFAGEQRRLSFDEKSSQFDVVLTRNKTTAVRTSQADALVTYLSRVHKEMAWVAIAFGVAA